MGKLRFAVGKNKWNPVVLEIPGSIVKFKNDQVFAFQPVKKWLFGAVLAHLSLVGHQWPSEVGGLTLMGVAQAYEAMTLV